MASSDVVAGVSLARLERIRQHLEDNYLRPGKLPGTLTLVAPLCDR